MNKGAKGKDGRKAAGAGQLWLRLPGLVREALYDTVIGAGLACVDEVLEAERVVLCGERYEHLAERQALRAGHVASSLVGRTAGRGAAAAGALTIAAYFVEYPRLMRGLPIMAAAATPIAKGTGAPLVKGGASAFTKGAAAAGATAVAVPFSFIALFRFFLKVGAVLFGSGYVLLAFLQDDLVDRFHWLTQAQLLDAVAVGQVTPGPVFSTATFIGYILGGTSGAVVATTGIFLPAFFFVSISGPLLPRLRRSPIAGAFLDGVNAGSLALMVVVTWELSRAAIVDVTTIVLAVASAILLLRFRLNSAWLVLLGAAAGALLIAHY